MSKVSQRGRSSVLDSQSLPTVTHRRDKPITAKRIERALDRLAEIMVRLGDEGQKCLPIYKRLEAELATYRALERDMAAVRERAKRSKAQRACRNSSGDGHSG
ncbi:hypothetical protein [Rhizobium leguminosarum]|uniref:hypothetical protein n=1 Tax=Rhizobium leguminosarum TaxID=384 RepID=UPI003F9C2206